MTRRRGLMYAFILLALTTATNDGEARRRSRRVKKEPAAAVDSPASARAPESAGNTGDKALPKKVKVFDFSGLGIEGKIRTPQLLYFLGRIKQELEQASLESRSFMPELVRSVEQGSL